MNQWPTAFVSFRQVDGLSFSSAYDMFTLVISDLYKKHLYLLESEHVNSSISEEVAAHASDTLSATESNNVIVEELAALSGQLETLAQELKEQ